MCRDLPGIPAFSHFLRKKGRFFRSGRPVHFAAELVQYNHKEHGRTVSMRILLNILWILFGGFFSALGWWLAGCLWCLSIIGIPVGLQCFKLASISLNPFGKCIRYEGSRSSASPSESSFSKSPGSLCAPSARSWKGCMFFEWGRSERSGFPRRDSCGIISPASRDLRKRQIPSQKYADPAGLPAQGRGGRAGAAGAGDPGFQHPLAALRGARRGDLGQDAVQHDAEPAGGDPEHELR